MSGSQLKIPGQYQNVNKIIQAGLYRKAIVLRCKVENAQRAHHSHCTVV